MKKKFKSSILYLSLFIQTEVDLKLLSTVFYGKDTIFLDFQLRNLPKVTKSKRNWSTEEDELLRKAIMLLKG